MRGASVDLDLLLLRWARRLQEENIGIGYPAMTGEYRAWRMGGGGGVFVLRVPTYWPDRALLILQEAILALPFDLRRPIIGRYLLGHDISHLARLCGCSRSSVRRRLEAAKQQLEDTCKF